MISLICGVSLMTLGCHQWCKDKISQMILNHVARQVARRV